MDEEPKPVFSLAIPAYDMITIEFNGRITTLHLDEDGQWIDDEGLVWDLSNED
jgi:hypothetical protein